MIVVFVVDTSPSMREPVKGGLSKLDLAKMFVEQTVKGLKKRVAEHNAQLVQSDVRVQESLRSIGLGYQGKDEILLLATGRQHTDHPATATCGAGGRLLVGFGGDPEGGMGDGSNGGGEMNTAQQAQHGVDAFQRELKRLKAAEWKSGTKFPDDGGGANGLNIALSAGLQLLSRYRLRFKVTENFGMGRLPSSAMLNPSGGTAAHALQSACLILLTDGMCLRNTPDQGGGSLKLQSSALLREFYQEPFRWDQRIYCMGVGGKEGASSSQYLHPQLRALSEVTGGSHMMLKNSISNSADMFLKLLAPPRPQTLPIPDPLHVSPEKTEPLIGANGSFVNGGAVCCFQSLERDFDAGQAPSKLRAALLYVPHRTLQQSESRDDALIEELNMYEPPIWPIAEAFFPSRKLDTLPPRFAEPLLLLSFYPSRLGSKLFEASSVMKMLQRLDQIGKANKEIVQQAAPMTQTRTLKRDTYICEWISAEGKAGTGPNAPQGMDYFPVVVQGAGRPSLGEGDGANWLSIGIIHSPRGTSSLSSSLSTGVAVSTLTLLPPEPHILLPLLIRAADYEHRALKKALGTDQTQLNPKQAAVVSRSVLLDEGWRSEFRAYLFRLPPYYIAATKRCLRNVLPISAHSLLNIEGGEGSLAMNSYSKVCHQKIRNAEMMAKANNERLERQEVELRRRGTPLFEETQRPPQQNQKVGHIPGPESSKPVVVGYGQYDPRTPVDWYLAALKHMPAPWMNGAGSKPKGEKTVHCIKKQANVMETLGDLPAKCLMAYYESRRRWIFGGSGLSTRGLFVEGVQNDGSNSQRCGAKRDRNQESLLSLAGIGVSQMNETTTAKMGDYRERLLWSRAPIVGTGANDSMGVSSTTSQNGAPTWSVEDEAMPITFFDPKTGEFSDSVEARIRSRLMVNFGNPFKDKRADSIVPEAFQKQRPRKGDGDMQEGPLTPPSSPPHDAYNSADEGEGEAIFAGTPLTQTKSPRRSPSRTDDFDDDTPPAKKAKIEPGQTKNPPPPPPPPPKSKEGKHGQLRPPPPPPPRRQVSGPPPPSLSPAPTSSSSIEDQSSLGTAGANGKPPPPAPGSATKKAVPPPAKPSSRPKQAPPPSQPSQQRDQQERRRSFSQVSQSNTMDMQSPDKKPIVDLPEGWICVWSKSQKRWYFFNTKNNKSVWQWPPPP